MVRKIIILSIIIFIALGAYFFVDALARDKIQESVIKRLQSKIGTAQSYEVEVSGSLINMIQGKLPELNIHGNKVLLRNGVTLESLQVRLQEIKFDLRKASISAIDKAVFEASLSQDELNGYVKKAHPDIPDINIDIKDGYLTMTARPVMLRYSTLVNAQGTLEIAEESTLVINLDKVQAAGRTASESSRLYLESAVNPVFDAKDISFHPKLTSVTLIPRVIKLTGHFETLDARAF